MATPDGLPKRAPPALNAIRTSAHSTDTHYNRFCSVILSLDSPMGFRLVLYDVTAVGCVFFCFFSSFSARHHTRWSWEHQGPPCLSGAVRPYVKAAALCAQSIDELGCAGTPLVADALKAHVLGSILVLF
jgi:hypothetical protein